MAPTHPASSDGGADLRLITLGGCILIVAAPGNIRDNVFRSSRLSGQLRLLGAPYWIPGKF